MVLAALFLLVLVVQAVLGHQTFMKRGSNTVCHNVTHLMTASNGAPVDDATSTMSAGERGPVVLQDFMLLEQLAHFNRERIPERIGHAKGGGAYGTFTVTDTSITKYCKASLFEKKGKKTEFVARFSTSGREIGSCDTVRDTRGGAFKFYTDDGNYDLVGNNAETFWIRDPMMIPSLIHSGRRDPASHLFDATMFWDFITLRPETTQHFLHIYSDLGTPDGFRHTDYSSSHAFKVVNKKGTPFYVKFSLLTNQGIKNLTGPASNAICASDYDYAIRDLYHNIEKKNFPSWTLNYQVMTFEQASQLKWNPFDLTKIWPRTEFPLFKIGDLVLNRNPVNYFAEIEQLALSPANLVPGIEPSPDKMLQARLFAYTDTQRYRIGPNFNQLPVNRPRVAVTNNQRDGAMCFYNQGADVNYFPNGVKNSAQPCPAAAQSKWSVTGDVQRYNTANDDNYSQAITLYNSFDELQRKALVANIAANLKTVKQPVQERGIAYLKNVDVDLSKQVATLIASKTK